MATIHPKLKQFYNSNEWQSLRMYLINERGKKYGGPTCEHCGKRVARSFELTGHHIIELTPENVDDANISLNPDNILIVHNHPCHDEIHGRFGFGAGGERRKYSHNVYLVYGPPLSGKTTLVAQRMEYGDLIVDMDRLYSAITMLPEYDKPNRLLQIVRGVHNLLIDNIKTRYGKWENAWVIGGYADKYKRDKMIHELGAEPIFCDVSKEECLQRLKGDQSRKWAEWSKYIEKWFEEYTT